MRGAHKADRGIRAEGGLRLAEGWPAGEEGLRYVRDPREPGIPGHYTATVEILGRRHTLELFPPPEGAGGPFEGMLWGPKQ